MLAYSSSHKSCVQWNCTGRLLLTLISSDLSVDLNSVSFSLWLVTHMSVYFTPALSEDPGAEGKGWSVGAGVKTAQGTFTNSCEGRGIRERDLEEYGKYV